MFEQYLRRRTNRVTGRVALAAAAVVGLLTMLAVAGKPEPQAVAQRGPGGVFRFSQPYHSYDPSAPELLLPLPPGLREWTPRDIETEIRERVGFERRRSELDVYYYRIGYTIAYPMPLLVSPRMDDLPVGIRGITYPWYTWLAWSLEERWRLLNCAWRRFGDRNAGRMLQNELAALAGWDQFCETVGNASLSTAQIASCLARAISVREGWNPDLFGKARSAAETMIERDVWPWFQREWPAGRELAAKDLGNIRVIILTRSAQLARVIDSPRAAELEVRARDALRAWFRYRLGQPPHNEASAYDGFLMDSLTEWLAGLPDLKTLLEEGRSAFENLANQWCQLTLPGRLDAQAPLGDVEPEMPFWTTALARLAAWYGWPDSAWLVHRLPVSRLPAAGLVEALEQAAFLKGGDHPPKPGPYEHPHAVTLRTGWDSADLLAAVGLTRSEIGHLHTDAGQVVLGWQGRFWITDPGYQQYRPGSERDFSVGLEAHNSPVISGKAQTHRVPRLVSLAARPGGIQRAVIDLSACYEGLPPGAAVEREIRLIPGEAAVVIVRDRLQGVGRGTEVQTFWQGGTHLAWAFREGWARLSDGGHAFWIGVFPGKVAAPGLDRLEGSRGPLTLHDKTTLPQGSEDRYWVFVGDSAGAWEPPVEKCKDIIQNWDESASAIQKADKK